MTEKVSPCGPATSAIRPYGVSNGSCMTDPPSSTTRRRRRRRTRPRSRPSSATARRRAPRPGSRRCRRPGGRRRGSRRSSWKSALADLLEVVAEDVGVERLARGVVAAHRLGPAERAGLVDEVGAAVRLRLPEAVCRARRVGADGDASDVEHVHRPEEEDASGRRGPRRRGVDVVGREVEGPRADLAGVVGILGHRAGDDVAVLARHDVAAGLGRQVLERPPEEARRRSCRAASRSSTRTSAQHGSAGLEGVGVDGHGRAPQEMVGLVSPGRGRGSRRPRPRGR